MKIESLHSWNVSPKEAIQIQIRLGLKIVLSGPLKAPRVIAGADVSFDKESPANAYAAVVLMDFPSLETIAEFTSREVVQFPYIPGLLSFREAPVLLNLFKKVSPSPDLCFFDGHGIAHPRRFGLASHMGLILDRPAVGLAKSKLVGACKEPGMEKASSSPLMDKENRTIGAALRTRENCKPIFVSAGHKINLQNAIELTLRCAVRHRIPEPTRRAHNLVTQFRKNYQRSASSSCGALHKAR